jgi:hypothetical protein
MKLILQIIFFVFLCQSCATFKSDYSKIPALEKSNLNLINGRYEISSIENTNEFRSFEYHNFIRELDRSIWKDTLNIDSTKTNHLELKLINNRNLEVTHLENDNVIKKRLIKVKYKKNGFLYLKNKNVKFKMIPYILGGLDVTRTRIKITKNKDLVLDVSNFQGGAAFLFMFLDWGTDRYRKTYKRVK